MPALPGKRYINIAVQIHRRIRHRMQVVRDLQPDVHGVRLAFVLARGHPHHTTARAFRNPRHHTILAGQRDAGFGIPKAHQRTRLCP